MAEYKLSELNTIDTVRSDDLLHLRVIKRSDMLGDEDRKMTYANFLASFRLERFLQLAGGNMTGNLGIVKLTYGGKDLLDPTGSSEIILGDVAKTFKINANGLALKVADATRTAFVYHTLNKPSPADLGMRSNSENDERYAQKATENTFLARQIININGVGLTLKSIYPDAGAFIEARDSSNNLRFTVGNLDASNDVTLVNSKGAKLTLGTTTVSVDKTFTVNGQVQPNDWGNFDARFFTQSAADLRFARLAANNTMTGSNIFTNYQTITADGALLRLKPSTTNGAVFMQAYNGSGAEAWYLGQPDGTKQDINLFNQMTSAAMRISTEFFFSKALNVTGQVKPSDFTNFDSRYVPSSLTNVLARTNAANTFNGYQTFLSDETPIVLKNVTLNAPLYIASMNANNVRRWYIGNGSQNNPETLFIANDTTGAAITLNNTVNITKTVGITGQVQPTDLSNFDSRYFVKTKLLTQSLMTRSANNVSEPTAVSLAYSGFIRNNGVSVALQDLAIHVGHPERSDAGHSRGISFQYGSKGLAAWTYAFGADGSFAGEAQLYTTAFKPTPSDIGAYTKAETDQKIATAITNSTDLNKIYPVGMVTFFASNVNPNTTFAGTTWTYLSNGNQRTIRIANPNGSDVGAVGGSDSKSIAVGHLPSHTHSFSATTSSFDYGTKGTNVAGWHGHTVSGSTAGAGSHSHNVAVRYLNTSQQYAYVGAAGQWAGVAGNQATEAVGNHTHTFSGSAAGDGNHSHTVAIGAHSHTVSGTTGGTGSGSAFDVTNAFIKLMAWVRTA
ncbi:tail fiber protein [Citrobacter phage Michonne]|uniref:Tail fiber protein n=1 Tax=Citrobacter phage Michonne TaxID=1675603 RepID=A0A0K1LP94_9CAUD|nr:tail fiber protein [Citrobacter phage Michonne]AKU44008.1 tail fiber protein [Citrobacter phage Michonne]AYR00802.1 tail fiber protein [Citrobacter phage Maleficent]